MNKFKRERAELFKAYRFSEERQQYVIEQARKNKARPKWIKLGVSFAILLVFILSVSIKQEQLVVSTTYTEEAAVAAFATIYSVPAEKLKLLEIKLPYKTDDDALIVARYQEAGDDVVHIQHMQFIGDEWQLLYASNQMAINDREYPMNWHYLSDETASLVVGIVEDLTIDAIYVGQQQATFYTLGSNKRLWIGEAMTAGSPIVYERDKKRERIPSYSIIEDRAIPYVEAVGNEYTASFLTDTMERGNGEYTKYPLVIDPYYYATNRYADGDVVVVNIEGQQQLTRIITEQNTNISIQEGTIVINNHVWDLPYMWAHFEGDNTIYTEKQMADLTIQPDEVFVMPDNWASDGVTGTIKKLNIVGKVIGYSVMDLPEPWSIEEKALYEKFARAHEINVLKDVAPQQVLRLQLYAQYVGDYKTMYMLYTKTSIQKSYEDWLATVNLLETKQIKQQLVYKAILVEQMELDEEGGRLQMPTERSLTFKMEQEEGIWKVVFETVQVIYQ